MDSSARRASGGWRGGSPSTGATPGVHVRMASLTQDKVRARHVRADSLRGMLRDCEAAAAAAPVSTKRQRVCMALGAAVSGKPHQAAMEVLESERTAGIECVRSESGRHFFKVPGSKGELYRTFDGYCSCKYTDNNAQRDQFFQCKHMLAAEMARVGLGPKGCVERTVTDEEYACEILDFSPDAAAPGADP